MRNELDRSSLADGTSSGTAMPGIPAEDVPCPRDAGLPDPPPCAHRYYSPGFAAYGAAVPALARGAYFPGDEAGFRCRLTLEACSDHPPDCPEWKESDLVCPACLEFSSRRPARAFEESRLITRHGRYYCPQCYERYASEKDVALAALAALRDALDDGDYLEGLVKGFEEEFGVSRYGDQGKRETLGLVAPDADA